MTANNEKWVMDWFERLALDCTPTSASGEAIVLFLPFSADIEVLRRCANVLSDQERQRADLFKTDDGKCRFIQRRAFRRYCAFIADGSYQDLSQIQFQESSKGRPFLPDREDLWFSFSSCVTGCLGAWSSSHTIGVDIESERQNIEAVELAYQFFTGGEAANIAKLEGRARDQTFLRYWSLKEAALKSIGEGLPFGMGAFEFHLVPEVRVVRAPRDASRFSAYLVPAPDSSAALVMQAKLSQRLRLQKSE